MHVISLYLVLHAYATTFDVMCVKKTEATKRGFNPPYALDPQYICGPHVLWEDRPMTGTRLAQESKKAAKNIQAGPKWRFRL
jgi:hypothetical protein